MARRIPLKDVVKAYVEEAGQICQGGIQRLNHHHKAGSTAERAVVQLLVRAQTIGPQVDHIDLHNAIGLGPLDETGSQRRSEELRKHGDNRDSHTLRLSSTQAEGI